MGKRISQLAEITTVDGDDLLNVVDVSDTTYSASGTNKKVKRSNLIKDLTVNNLASGVLDTDLSSVSGNDDTIPSAKATKAYVDGKSTVLYDNSSGTTSTITLSSSSANFDYFAIYFKTSNGSYDFAEVPSPNGKLVNLMSGNYYQGTQYIQIALISISGTSITWSNNTQIALSSTPTITINSSGNYVYITKIVGIK